MSSFLAATVGSFLQQTKCSSLSSLHLLALLATIIQTSTILFMPSSSSSGIVTTLRVQTLPLPPTLPTPTTKTPTRTTPSLIVESPDSMGLCLALGTLLLCLLFGFATVYNIGRKHTDPNRPPPRRNPRRGKRSSSPPPPPPPPPPTSDPTDNDDTKDDGTDNSDSNPDNSGNDDSSNDNDDDGEGEGEDEGKDEGDGDGGEDGDGDGDGDGNNDSTNEQDADDSQNDSLSHDEPDPEDPPPPPPITFNEDDDIPKVTLYGPARSVLYFLLGGAVGLLAKLVTMNAPTGKYRYELHHLRSITFRLLGPFRFGSSGSSTMEIPHSCHHDPFVLATAQTRLNPPRARRRIKVSLPPILGRIFFKYIPEVIVRISRAINVTLPPTLTNILSKHIPDMTNVGLPPTLTNIFFEDIPDIVVRVSRTINVNLLPALTSMFFKHIPVIIARISRTHIYLVNTIWPPVNWFINAMAADLVVVEACISIAIDRIRALDAEHGSSLRLIAGYVVLVLVVLEIYYAEPRNPTNATPNAPETPCFDDAIIFPFADVDLPLKEDSKSLQLNIPHADPTDCSEDNSSIFPPHDTDLSIVKVEPDDYCLGTIQTAIANVDVDVENNDGIFPAGEIETSITEPEVEVMSEPVQGVEELCADCMSVSSSSGFMDAGQTEIPEVSQESHNADNESSSSTSSNEDSINVDAHALAADDVQFEGTTTRTFSDEDSGIEDETSVQEDFDMVLECLASLFDLSSTISGSLGEESAEKEVVLAPVSPCLVPSGVCNSPNKIMTDDLSPSSSNSDAYDLAAEDVQAEEIAVRTPSGQESHTEDEANADEDPDTVLECLAGLFDSSSSTNQSFFEEERPLAEVAPEVVPGPVSPRRVPGGVCIRAFTSCEAFAAMFGFDTEKPFEFLYPLPPRLERLLPSYYIFPHTPARYFTLGAPPATPTTPYSRWEKEGHTSTPFIPSPFGPRTPLRTPPTIVIPSPTSSEGTQPPDDSESPAAIRARRLDRKWAKMMAKRQRNEARNLVPRIQIDERENSFSSSLASDTSIRSFFDPHASINQGIRDAEPEIEAPEPSQVKKWKPRSPGDPVPRQRRRWRNKDVLVGAGEDEGYGAVGVARD